MSLIFFAGCRMIVISSLILSGFNSELLAPPEDRRTLVLVVFLGDGAVGRVDVIEKNKYMSKVVVQTVHL
jgi:hypothetical protein